MGLKSGLKDFLFSDVQPEFKVDIDRKIYNALDRPKSCSEIKNELGLSRSHAHKRLLVMQVNRLVKRNGNTFSQSGRFGLRPKPRVWRNLVGGAGIIASLPLQEPGLAAFSIAFLCVSALVR